MIVYYRVAGVVAVFALLLNLILLLAILVEMNAVLTLPGIAALVLTVGMAVDANVLIFERIREELRLGQTTRNAVNRGYSRAFRTILDANVTTLITALVLLRFGTGPIKGFAVTLSVGIVVSMFTALFVSRIIFDLMTTGGRVRKLSI
jgi:preprotein translocase subunit SecD